MNNQIPFQFSVLKYIHDSFTGEFLNVGLAFYSQEPTWFSVRLLDKHARLTKTFPSADGDHYRKYIANLQLKFDILASQINQKQIALLGKNPEMLDALLAQVLPVDDSAIQFGKVHGGVADDLEDTFDKLFYRFVEIYLPSEKNERQDEAGIWHAFSKPLRRNNVIHHLRPHTVVTPSTEIDFDHAWKNGKWNALQPISFDMVNPGSIQRKAMLWFASNVVIDKKDEVGRVYYLLGRPHLPENSLLKAYNKAKDLLATKEHANKVQIIEEDEMADFGEMISKRIEKDASHE